jgi:arylsulfatase A-like enzyme
LVVLAVGFWSCDIEEVLASPATGNPSRGPNILFIEVDDLQYKYLGCMGNKVVATPEIDGLAKRGVLFRNAVCQGTMCGPSRNSLITGTYPHNLGFYKNGQCGDLPKDLWAFPAALQRAGYESYWVGKSHVHASQDGIQGNTSAEIKCAALGKVMGFDRAFASLGRALLLSKQRKPSDDAYLKALHQLDYFDKFYKDRRQLSTLPDDVYMDGYFTKSAIEWIDDHQKKHDQPFFLWLNLSLPHGPLDVAQPYHAPYATKQFQKVIPAGDVSDLPSELVASKYKQNKSVLDNQRQFAACVAFIDMLVGKLVDCLQRQEIRDDTMIVFFSDHGIMLADHGLSGKGTLFKEVLNPSLIISWPSAPRRGVMETRPVELLDILKTSLQIAGASRSDIDRPFGESLLPLLTREGEYQRQACFAEMTGFYAVVTGQYKYINNFDYQENVSGPALFDLKNDPDETRNVADNHRDVIASMRSMANDWMKATQPVRPPYFYSKKNKAR